MAKRWRCVVCGYIHVGDDPPYVCPICGAPRKMFELIEDPRFSLLERCEAVAVFADERNPLADLLRRAQCPAEPAGD